jgi:hypothetical protein
MRTARICPRTMMSTRRSTRSHSTPLRHLAVNFRLTATGKRASYRSTLAIPARNW